MRNYLTLLFAVLLFGCSKESGPSQAFLNAPQLNDFTYGGVEQDVAVDIVVGNYALYILGTTYDNDENGDIYLIKADFDGRILMDTTFGGPLKDEGVALIHASEIEGRDILVLLGTTESYGNGGKDIYALAVYGDGEVAWTQTLGGPGDEIAADLLWGNDGEFGYLGTSTSNNPNGNVILVYTDGNGTIDNGFEKEFDAGQLDAGASMVMDKGVYKMLCYTTSYGTGDRDLLLLDAERLGNGFERTSTIGGDNYEEAQEIIKVEDNNFLLVGHSASIHPEHNMYIVKVDDSHEIIWEKHIGGNLHDGAQTALMNSEGNYVVVGRTDSYGPGGESIIMITLDRDGEILEEEYFGGFGNDRIDKIIEFNDKYYMVGTTDSKGAGDYDAYMIILNK